VYDALLMRILKRGCDFKQYRDDLQIAGAAQAAQITAGRKLHRQHRRIGVTLRAVHLQNRRMIEQARDLVLVLKAGALPVPIRPSNEQMIGPSLGADGVAQGVRGGLVSVLIVLVFMALYYEVGGLIADVMVLLHLMFLLSAQAFFGASLTLPGLVAIALNMGMAVDANVLVNERIREELRAGKSPRVAVEQGFSRAFSSIFDSQITTLIAGIPELATTECAWLVPAGSVEALVGALRTAATTAQPELERMALEGKRRVRERHDVDVEAKKLRALFEGA